MGKYRTLAWLTALWLGLMVAGQAAPYNFDDKLVPLELTLAEYPDREGFRWAGADGVTRSGTEYLTVKGISPLSAAKVFLLAPEPGTSAKLSLAKFVWDESLRECATDGEGFCSIGFKTHDDVGFRLEAEPGTAWRLLLVTTPETAYEDALASPIYAADPADFEGRADRGAVGDSADGAPSGSNWIWMLVVTILVIVIAALLFRRRPSGTAAILAAGGCGWLLFAPVEPAAADSIPIGSPAEARAMANIWEADEEISRRTREAGRVDAMRSRVSGFAGHVDEMLEGVEAMDEFLDAYTNLHTCSQVSNPAGAPRVPSFCAGNSGCQTCFSGARKEFNETRGTLEQLRVIYTCTKNMTDKAISLGDSGSNVHAVVGLAWQAEKRKIEASVESLKQAYDNKYLELMGRLQGSMFQMSECEAQYGQPDWYDRFGYVYYEFMKDKYKRSSE